MDESQDENIYAEIERLRKARRIVLPRPKNFNKITVEDDSSSRNRLAVTTVISVLIGVALFLLCFYLILP